MSELLPILPDEPQRVIFRDRKISGSCNHCMLCCIGNVFAETDAERNKLQWCPQADVHTCSCKYYEGRPEICRRYPSLSDFDAGRVPRECGFYIETQDPKKGNQMIFHIDLAETPLHNQIALSFCEGARCEIRGQAKAQYKVTFINQDTGLTVFTALIQNAQFAAPSAKYFVRWQILVEENGVPVLDYRFDPTGKRVWIGLNSPALGDTIAWVPYAEEFRRSWGCQVSVSTERADLFLGVYPDLTFVDPRKDDPVKYYSAYVIGAFDNDYEKNKNNWRLIPLQQVAADVLGLEYREVRPLVARSTEDRPIPGRYVAISEFSTFQAKLWNHPGGWQRVVSHLKERGYEVMSISKEPTSLDVIRNNGLTIAETIRNIQHADAFIGVSSGPSWLAWALGVPVVIISGFTEPFTEMSNCQRVINSSVCTGCANDYTLPYDRGNWNWCPRNKNFECTRAITPDMVEAAVDRALAVESAAPQVRTGRVLFLLPHCSTGGMPQYVIQAVESLLHAGRTVAVVEGSYAGPDYVVQRNRLRKLCQFWTLNGDKDAQLRRILDEFQPDVVHLQEMAETFLSNGAANLIYGLSQPAGSTPWKVIETTHARCSLKPEQKRWRPDGFVFVTAYHLKVWEKFSRDLGVQMSVAEYRLPPRTRPDRKDALSRLSLDPSRRHVLHVGLFTPQKNQGFIFDVARQMPEIQFHFVGNTAPNFQNYWKPLLEAKPSNCVLHGELADVDPYYAACDLFLFPSLDECNPLAVKEALSWGMPVLLHKMETYHGHQWLDSNLNFYAKDDAKEVAEFIRNRFPSMRDGLEEAYCLPAVQPVEQPASQPAIRVEEPEIGGWFDPMNRRILEGLISKYNVKSVLEVGSFLGLSTAWFAKRVEKVTCVDRWTQWEENGQPVDLKPFNIGPDFYENFRSNMVRAGVWNRISCLRGDSDKMVEMAPDADLVYIDASHTYEGVAKDIRLYLPRSKRVISGDDYTQREGFGVIPAVKDFLPHHHGTWPIWWAITGKVAVVIPNLNGAKTLGRAILSACDQTLHPSEVIVVDGGSSDNSESIAKDLGARWMVDRTDGRRIGRARNMGIRSTDAEFIVPLDSDDWMEKDYIARCLEEMVDGVGVVAPQMFWSNGDGVEQIWRPDPPFTYERILQQNRLFTCSMIRKEAWESVGGYDDDDEQYEDWLLWSHIIRKGWNVAMVDQPLFHYRQGTPISPDRHSLLCKNFALKNSATV